MNNSLLANISTSSTDITWNYNLQGIQSKVATIYSGRFEHIINRLLSMSKPNKNGCWVWDGSTSNYGKYPKISLAQKERKMFDGNNASIGAHKLSHILFNGAIKKDNQVRHKCGCSTCINPAHLEQGTAKQNSFDKWRDGTMTSAKLTESVVRTIKHLSITTTQANIAEMCGVSPSTISAIINNKTWKHVH